MNNKTEQHMAENFLPFDLIVLVQDVAKRWLVILLAALIMGIGTYIFTDMRYEPVYRTTTTFVVSSRSSSASVYTNLTNTTNLASVFSELINSSIMRKEIQKQLSTDSFGGTINAAAVPETNLLTMTVTASDPRTAFLVAQAIIDHHEAVTYQVVDGVVLEVLQAPVVPSWPINYANATGNMTRVMILAAALMVLILAVGSFYRDAVRSANEARKKLDCSFLGEIPHESKYKTLAARIRRRKTGILISNPATSFRFVETFRKLRRRVELHLRRDKVIMVTSVLENEGKSTVAVNLAIALAQKHEKVLLIDCDLRKPACHALLEQKKIAHGLRDVLTGKVNIPSALIQDKKSNLYLLLETRGTANSGDLISSDVMQALLRWARQEFDYVVLDMPPMAKISDAEGMNEYADASILVVRQNAATAPAINKFILALDSGKARLLGCVLNNVYSTILSSGHGYGYGYGYGYGKYGYGKYGHYGNYGKAPAAAQSEKK